MPSVARLWRRSAGRLAPLCLLPFLCTACTMAVHTSVHDQSGRPLPDAVVSATPRQKRLALPFTREPKGAVVLKNFAFDPPVLPVRVGTSVSFLNRDDIRHQIYSISPAKNFELFANRLSSSPAVVFEQPGVVVLGSAANDRMIGHIYVLATPYFATTGANGKAVLTGLPRGAYEVRVWHPDMKPSADAASRRVSGSSGRRVGLEFTLTVQPGRSPDRLPSPAAAPGR